MDTSFSPKSSDELTRPTYPSGKIKEESWIRNGDPANGWSRKTFYEHGGLQLHECFSNSMVIEQLHYDASGSLTAHRVYSHKAKQLIDKPVQTKVIRPNVVDGCEHMGFYYRHMPAISRFIGAIYNEDELSKAYDDFIELPMPEGDEEEARVKTWSIRGPEMGFAIHMEKGEGYYFWHLWAGSEEAYESAKNFMAALDRN